MLSFSLQKQFSTAICTHLISNVIFCTVSGSEMCKNIPRLEKHKAENELWKDQAKNVEWSAAGLLQEDT